MGEPDTAQLRGLIEEAVPERPFNVEFWDGEKLPATNGGGPTFSLRSADALAHAIRAPGQLGLGRAYVSGQLDIDDMDAVVRILDTWKPPPIGGRTKAKLLLAAKRTAGKRRPPTPEVELNLRGERHTQKRDLKAVRHHYDVSNDFFELFLGESLTYSCAIFSRGAQTLEEAQETKLELVCTKLGLEKGQRVLDVGCGWGSFAIHAARNHGVHVTGITLSEPQAELARERVAKAGLADSVDIRVVDYRELEDEPFDAIASIGMVEHVGFEQIDVYAESLAKVLKPGGRLLNHGIARLRHTDPEAGAFSERYVFPDADPLHLSRIVESLEQAGFEVTHVEDFREDYAETLRHWAQRLDENLDEAIRLAGEERVRVWRLYLRAARHGFESGFTSIYQVNSRLTHPPADG